MKKSSSHGSNQLRITQRTDGEDLTTERTKSPKDLDTQRTYPSEKTYLPERTYRRTYPPPPSRVAVSSEIQGQAKGQKTREAKDEGIVRDGMKQKTPINCHGHDVTEKQRRFRVAGCQKRRNDTQPLTLPSIQHTSNMLRYIALEQSQDLPRVTKMTISLAGKGP